jgi:hypothetical protein
VIADGTFVLEDQLEKLDVAEAVGLGLLEADLEGGCQAGEPELAEGGAEGIVHGSNCFGGNRKTGPSRRRIGCYGWAVR